MKIIVKFSLIAVVLLRVTLCAYAQYTKAGEHFKKGLQYHKQGILDEALKEYKEAIFLDDTLDGALYNAGRIYGEKEQWENALDMLYRASKLNPYNGEVYWNLAVVSFFAGKYKDAAKYNDKSQELGFSGTAQFREMLEPYKYEEIDFNYTSLMTKENVVLKIRGNISASDELIRDALVYIEGISGESKFKAIEMEFISSDGASASVQKWIVTFNDYTEKPYMVTFIVSPQGGTDFLIEPVQ